MFAIEKLTQSYDRVEDRVRISIQDADGRIICLWLTLRLANMMVGVLARWSADIQEDIAKKKHEVQVSYAVAGSKPPALPVKASAAKEEALMTTVDFTLADKGYRLTFKWGVTGIASITMQAKEMQQYINALHQMYEAAKWPLIAWPSTLEVTESPGLLESQDLDAAIPASKLVH